MMTHLLLLTLSFPLLELCLILWNLKQHYDTFVISQQSLYKDSHCMHDGDLCAFVLYCAFQQDPDAPLRQGKCLADLDKDDDDMLLKYVFFCIRAGRLDEVL